MAIHLLLLTLYLHPPVLAARSQAAPPLADLDRFPALGVCEDQLDFLTARRAWLENMRQVYRQPEYQQWFEAAVADVEERTATWRALQQARWWLRSDEEVEAAHQVWSEDSAPKQRRLYAQYWLAHLGRLLCPRDYQAGSMPGLIGRDFWLP